MFTSIIHRLKFAWQDSICGPFTQFIIIFQKKKSTLQTNSTSTWYPYIMGYHVDSFRIIIFQIRISTNLPLASTKYPWLNFHLQKRWHNLKIPNDIPNSFPVAVKISRVILHEETQFDIFPGYRLAIHCSQSLCAENEINELNWTMCIMQVHDSDIDSWLRSVERTSHFEKLRKPPHYIFYCFRQ